jgi:hypothetical protein
LVDPAVFAVTEVAFVGAAAGCDLLMLLFKDQKIAASLHSAAPTGPQRIGVFVGAAAGCDLLMLLFKIKRSQPPAAPTEKA